MTNSAILTQAVRNIIPYEWPLTYQLVGIKAGADNAYKHLKEWPNGQVARHIRREYLRLLSEAAS